MPITYNVGARSIFVTVTAWVFIVLGVLASVSALVQNAAVASLLPQAAGAAAAARLPALTGWLVGYLPWIVGSGFVVSLALLASAVGLLLRLDWARRVFIGLLAFAIVANLLGLWLQHEVVQSLVAQTLHGATLPAQAKSVFGGFVTAAQVMAVIVSFGLCGLLAWVIGRLRSAAVRQEFA